MKWLVRSILFIAIACLGFWMWIVFNPSPEKAIRKQLASLARSASLNADDSPLVRIATAQSIADYFSPDARLVINIPQVRQQTIEGRDDISEAAMFLQSRVRSVKVEFLDLNITVGKEKKTAQVDLTAKITFPGDDDLTAQELKFLLKQNDGRWLIARVETVKAFN